MTWLLALAPIIASGTSFACTPVRVWDGDGPVWCAEGPKLRIAGITAAATGGGALLLGLGHALGSPSRTSLGAPLGAKEETP